MSNSFCDDAEPAMPFIPPFAIINSATNLGASESDSICPVSVAESFCSSTSPGLTVCVPVGAPEISTYTRRCHSMEKTRTQLSSNGGRPLRKRFKGTTCSHKTEYYCTECNLSSCKDDVCGRFCFYEHICKYYIERQSPGIEWLDLFNAWIENAKGAGAIPAPEVRQTRQRK